MSKSKSGWLREVALLPLLTLFLVFAVFLAFDHLMGCGWSGSCAEFGFETFVILIVVTLLAIGRWFYVLVKFLSYSKEDSEQTEES